MKSIPMIFNTEMVQALLSGNKTVTRRPMSAQPSSIKDLPFRCVASSDKKSQGKLLWSNDDEITSDAIKEICNIGDEIYVRETWGVVSHDYDENDNIVEWSPDRPSMIIKDMKFGQGYYSGNVIYRSDGKFTWQDDYGDEISAWKPSIHMPKKLSRITLKVTDVRIERVQDITEEQAKAEGSRKQLWFTPNGVKEDDWINLGGSLKANYKNGFASIWDSIYSNWNDNPYVWVIEFEVIKHTTQTDK